MTDKNPITAYKLDGREWAELDKRYGQLCKFQAWQLLRKNQRNSHTNELDDLEQELREAMVIAGMYHKRQVFIETAIKAVKKYARTDAEIREIGHLEGVWAARKSRKQRFGVKHGESLRALLESCVPAQHRPDPRQPLNVDDDFQSYCKSITWNRLKTIGRKITKDRSIRNGMVSLSEHSHMAGRL